MDYFTIIDVKIIKGIELLINKNNYLFNYAIFKHNFNHDGQIPNIYFSFKALNKGKKNVIFININT